MKPHAYLFVDGSSAHKDDIGAWAALAATVTERKLLYGVTYPTTISRCELVPIIEGLRWIKQNWVKGRGFRVIVYSDSEYTIKTLSGLCQRNKNKELWVALDKAAEGMKIHYVWRERNTLPYMELCDAMCGGLRRATYRVMEQYFKDPKTPEAEIPYGALPDETEEHEIQGDTNEIHTHG
jgi:ribonuclease HI